MTHLSRTKDKEEKTPQIPNLKENLTLFIYKKGKNQHGIKHFVLSFKKVCLTFYEQSFILLSLKSKYGYQKFSRELEFSLKEVHDDDDAFQFHPIVIVIPSRKEHEKRRV